MSEHRYTLEPYKDINSRHRCPSCQHRNKTFSLYIDTETGEHLHPTVGRCNRESNCGHHYTPKQYFQDNNIAFDATHPKAYKPPVAKPHPKPISFIPFEIFKNSLNHYQKNHFVSFLIGLFGDEVAFELVKKYFIASSNHWNGSTVFWQIDTQGKIRTGKIMLYSPSTGKREKNLQPNVYWAHKALKQPEFGLQQCLFGEHLLNERNKDGELKPVAVVESEKTAVIASVYFEHLLKDKNFVWVAVGSLTNLNAEKCRTLKGRTVTLFPDLKGFEKWSSKAKELSHLATFTISDLLERKATEAEREQGFDLADYLIKLPLKDFVKTEPEAPPHPPTIHTFDEVEAFEQPEKPQPESWEHEITELEIYFAATLLPATPLKLNKCSTITDCSIFIESHFATVKANDGNRTFLPFLQRLQELKQVLTTNLN
jgi:hypothetical protein